MLIDHIMIKTFYGEKLLTQTESLLLLKYNYLGVDHSYLYRFLYSPLADLIVYYIISDNFALV